MSDNTEDIVSDPNTASLQESRTAIDNYASRKRDYAALGQGATVMRSDFPPVRIPELN